MKKIKYLATHSVMLPRLCNLFSDVHLLPEVHFTVQYSTVRQFFILPFQHFTLQINPFSSLFLILLELQSVQESTASFIPL